MNRPRGDEVNIKLEINGKERIYYELDEDGLHYKNIGKQLNPDDSIQVGIFTRTIKAPTGKKRRNYGFTIQINNDKPFELKYKKEGSNVTSPDRPGWNYTKSGIWYIYLPIQDKGTKIQIVPMKGNPVVYVRLTSNLIEKEGNYTEVIKTVNRQDRIEIETKDKRRKYYTF